MNKLDIDSRKAELEAELAELNSQHRENVDKVNTVDTSGIHTKITRQNCAIEVMRHLKLTKNLILGSIVGGFGIIIGGMFGLIGSSVVLIAMVAGGAVILIRTNSEIKRLQGIYRI